MFYNSLSRRKYEINVWKIASFSIEYFNLTIITLLFAPLCFKFVLPLNLFYSPNVTKMNRSRIGRWAGRSTCVLFWLLLCLGLIISEFTLEPIGQSFICIDLVIAVMISDRALLIRYCFNWCSSSDSYRHSDYLLDLKTHSFSYPIESPCVRSPIGCLGHWSLLTRLWPRQKGHLRGALYCKDVFLVLSQFSYFLAGLAWVGSVLGDKRRLIRSLLYSQLKGTSFRVNSKENLGNAISLNKYVCRNNALAHYESTEIQYSLGYFDEPVKQKMWDKYVENHAFQ